MCVCSPAVYIIYRHDKTGVPCAANRWVCIEPLHCQVMGGTTMMFSLFLYTLCASNSINKVSMTCLSCLCSIRCFLCKVLRSFDNPCDPFLRLLQVRAAHTDTKDAQHQSKIKTMELLKLQQHCLAPLYTDKSFDAAEKHGATEKYRTRQYCCTYQRW